MKKTIWLVLGVCLSVAACTSKEQEQEIRTFWKKQVERLDSRFLGRTQMTPQDIQEQLRKIREQAGSPSQLKESAAAGVEKISQKFAAHKSAVSSSEPSPVVEKPVSKPVLQTAQKPARKMAAKPVTTMPAAPSQQVLEVTLDGGDAFPGVAPYKDRVRMKKEWNNLQVRNQAAVRDILKTFGTDVYNEAVVITARTEQQLKKTARTAGSYAAYVSQQRVLVAQQEQSLQKLMQQNVQSIRSVK